MPTLTPAGTGFTNAVALTLPVAPSITIPVGTRCLLAVAVAGQNISTNVTDSQGNTWTQDETIATAEATHTTVALFSATLIASLAIGDTITVALGAHSAGAALLFTADAAALDITATAAGNGTAYAVPATAVPAGDLAVAVIGSAYGSAFPDDFTPGAGWTVAAASGADGARSIAVMHRTTAGGNETAPASATFTRTWAEVLAGYRPAAAPDPTNTRYILDGGIWVPTETLVSDGVGGWV